MTQVARDRLYRRHRFPAKVIAHAVWLYLRFPLSLRMVEDLLAARGIIVSHQTVRLWVEKFGRHFANDIRRRAAGRLGDKWYLDEVVITIAGKKHLALARRRSRRFCSRRTRAKPPQYQGRQTPYAKDYERTGRSPRVMITDKLRSYGAARREIMPDIEHRSHKGLNNRAENSHQPTRRRERIMKGFKSARHLQRFVSIHDPVANLFHIPRHDISSDHHRELRTEAMQMWNEIARLQTA
jgi:putative transposase